MLFENFTKEFKPWKRQCFYNIFDYMGLKISSISISIIIESLHTLIKLSRTKNKVLQNINLQFLFTKTFFPFQQPAKTASYLEPPTGPKAVYIKIIF